MKFPLNITLRDNKLTISQKNLKQGRFNLNNDRTIEWNTKNYGTSRQHSKTGTKGKYLREEILKACYSV
jgi:hypothetical protein